MKLADQNPRSPAAMKPAIVVGTDFSEAASCAIEQAVSLAATLQAHVVCVHAWEDAPGLQLHDDPTSGFEEQLRQAVAASGAHEKGVHVETVVRRGRPWEKLLNVATEVGACLIVVGASGDRNVGSKLGIGTVTARLAAMSTRLVLIIPSPTVVGP
jgi:nucleotide-binding universal stress UspA family protein